MKTTTTHEQSWIGCQHCCWTTNCPHTSAPGKSTNLPFASFEAITKKREKRNSCHDQNYIQMNCSSSATSFKWTMETWRTECKTTVKTAKSILLFQSFDNLTTWFVYFCLEKKAITLDNNNRSNRSSSSGICGEKFHVHHLALHLFTSGSLLWTLFRFFSFEFFAFAFTENIRVQLIGVSIRSRRNNGVRCARRAIWVCRETRQEDNNEPTKQQPQQQQKTWKLETLYSLDHSSLLIRSAAHWSYILCVFTIKRINQSREVNSFYLSLKM